MGLSILAMGCLMMASSSSGYICSILLGLASELLLNVSISSYAINDNKKMSTIVWLIIAGAVFGIIAIFKTFGGLIGCLIDFSNSFSRTDLSGITEYYINQSAICQIIKDIIFVIAFAIGISSVKNKYKLPWILMLIFYALTALNLMAYKSEVYLYGEYGMINSCLGLISLTILIILLVKGGDADTASKNVSISQNTNSNATLYSTVAQKSEILIQLKELKDSGVISEEEFQSEKTKILGQ